MAKKASNPKKQLSIVEGPRVRFAPAPTGFLHIGGARTILFNWLFARKYAGSFILRIEDTDPERSRLEFERDIFESVRWLGLDWDEGPEVGGKFGPYHQSERLPIYQKYITKLLEGGQAYRCFCKQEDLEAERQDMIARGIAPKYSGRCRNLREEKVKSYLAEGRNYIIRIKMPEKRIAFEDLIHGRIEFDTSLLGDIAIVRNETTPLWHLAVVIDDFEMQITHVIRGDEHISNTPKQIILQELLGFKTPAYAHVPLLLGSDRSKLSKRHGAIPVREYKEQGYLPEALINFLALLGWHPAGDREIFSREELIRGFSLERIQKAGAIFNQDRLDWLNSYYIKIKQSSDLVDVAAEFLLKAGLLKKEGRGWINSESKESVSRKFIASIVEIEKERLQKFSDFPNLTEFFFRQPQYDPALLVWKEMSLDDVKRAILKLLDVLKSVPEDGFRKEKLNEGLSPHYGSDKGEILWPLRVALTGRRASPGPLEIAEVLGKATVLARLEYARNILEKI
jgi:glutamyl-tRNA synthetase